MERRRQALELRKSGASYDAIAQQLGYASRGKAYDAVKALLMETIQEPSDELRRLEVERLDGMLIALASQVRSGNQGAIDRALKIMQRRADLLGLDAPKRTDITSGGDPLKGYIGIPVEDV